MSTGVRAKVYNRSLWCGQIDYPTHHLAHHPILSTYSLAYSLSREELLDHTDWLYVSTCLAMETVAMDTFVKETVNGGYTCAVICRHCYRNSCHGHCCCGTVDYRQSTIHK